MLINYISGIEPLIKILKQKNIFIRVVKNFYTGVFSFLTKNILCDLGIFFFKKNKSVNVTFFSGNGYYLSHLTKSLFENELNSESTKMLKDDNFKKYSNFDNELLIKNYIALKKPLIENFKKINVFCQNSFFKKVLKKMFKNNIKFVSVKTKNFYKLSLKNGISICKEGKKIPNSKIIKEIELFYNNDVFFEKTQKNSDISLIISTYLMKKAKIGIIKNQIIFFDTTHTLDLLDSFFHILNLNLIWILVVFCYN